MFSAFGDTFKTDLLGQSTTTLSQLLPVVALLVGMLLAFLIFRSIVNMLLFKGGNKKEYPDDENTDDVDGDDFDDDF